MMVGGTQNVKSRKFRASEIIDKTALRKAVGVLRVFTNQHTLEICYLLDAQLDTHVKSMNVSDIFGAMGIVQTDASFALGKLRRIGVVIAVRKGKEIHYRLKRSRFDHIVGVVEKLSILYHETDDEVQTRALLGWQQRSERFK